MKASELAIRPMRAADVARVLEIASGLPTAPHWNEQTYLAALEPSSTPRRIAIVAAELTNDEPVGFAVSNLLAPQAELETVAVAAEAQGQGIGRVLLERLFAELRQAGAVEVFLESRTSNLSALGLYRRLGFRETGNRSGYYTDPIEDAVVMSLTIG